MADYSRLAFTPLFTPFSYEEIAAPGLQMAEEQRAIEDAYAEMSDDEILDLLLSGEGEGATGSKELVNNFRKELDKLINILSTYGVLGTSRLALNNLKRLYLKVKKVKNTFDERKEEIIKQRDFLAAHPNIMLDNDLSTWGVDEILANPDWMNYKTIDLENVYKEAAVLGNTLASYLKESGLSDSEVTGLINQFSRQGFDLDTVNRMVSEGRVPVEFRTGMLQFINKYQNSGFRFDEQSAARINSAINQGWYAGFAPQEENKYVADPNTITPYQQLTIDLNYLLHGYKKDPATGAWVIDEDSPYNPENLYSYRYNNNSPGKTNNLVELAYRATHPFPEREDFASDEAYDDAVEQWQLAHDTEMASRKAAAKTLAEQTETVANTARKAGFTSVEEFEAAGLATMAEMAKVPSHSEFVEVDDDLVSTRNKRRRDTRDTVAGTADMGDLDVIELYLAKKGILIEDVTVYKGNRNGEYEIVYNIPDTIEEPPM